MYCEIRFVYNFAKLEEKRVSKFEEKNLNYEIRGKEEAVSAVLRLRKEKKILSLFLLAFFSQNKQIPKGFCVSFNFAVSRNSTKQLFDKNPYSLVGSHLLGEPNFGGTD